MDTKLIEEAASYLKDKVRQTPIEYSSALSKLTGLPCYLKLESLQLTGSFKIRGAYFRLSSLKEREIITCSAGNHGKACAYVAKELGIKAKIFLPSDVDQSKFEAIKNLGAEIVLGTEPGFDAAESQAKAEAKERGIPFISAFDDEWIMAGNGGSLGAEILEQFPEVENIILPVGGGGMGAGLSFIVKEKKTKTQLIACQHKDSAGLALSLKQGKAVTYLPGIETLAGGIEGGIGESCFEILKSRIDNVCLISEEEIKDGFRWMLKEHQYLIEPTAAVVIGAALAGKLPKMKGNALFVLSGRNVSYKTISKLVC